MSLNNPTAYWAFNCGKEDFDIVVDWGISSIQRQNLRYVRMMISVSLPGNQVIQKTSTYTPYNAPTSDPFSFPGNITIAWPDEQSSGTSIFMGNSYSFIASIFILSGGVPGQEYVDEEYIFNSSSVSSDLKFCSSDPLFNDFFQCSSFVPDCS